jgi:hypothetical protein
MFHALFHRQDTGGEPVFSAETKPAARVRHPVVERIIWICWILIAIKCPIVLWAVPHYHIPFSPWWVIAPTVAGAAVCTAVYYGRRG